MRFHFLPAFRYLGAKGKQVVLSAAALVAFAQAPPPGSQPTANQPPTQTPPQVSTPLVIIDPAHGGSDSGAALNAAMPEKDVTLVFARRLRQELTSLGLQARLLRDGDATLTTDQRAEAVNGLHPALYFVIHATSLGSGMRLYTAMLPRAADNHGPFLDWQTAQGFALDRSYAIQDRIARALQKNHPPVRSLSAPLRPLNNVVVPAVAVELAASNGDVSQLASSDYQQIICSALAKGISSSVPLLRTQSGPQQ